MLTHRGFSAWVVVDDQPLPEYLVAVDNEQHRISCWIPGEEGKNFVVYWKDHGGKVDSCAFITLDGLVVPGRFLFGEGVTMRQGVRTSQTSERLFSFQKVDEKEIESDPNSPSNEVGMITLRIKRVARIGVRPANSIQDLPKTLLGKRKAGDICVGFGEEVNVYDQYPSTWAVKPYDDPAAKYASAHVSFVFRYRSREFLESQGISTERLRPSALTRPPVRRVVSLPPNISAALSPSMVGPPKKKPRLSSTDPVSKSHPETSLETRRTASYNLTPTQNNLGSLPEKSLLLVSGDQVPEQQYVGGDSGYTSSEPGSNQSSSTD